MRPASGPVSRGGECGDGRERLCRMEAGEWEGPDALGPGERGTPAGMALSAAVCTEASSVRERQGRSEGRAQPALAGRPALRASVLEEALTHEQRQRMAERYGVHALAVKPCVATIGPQPEGMRAHYCHILAVEMLRAGATRDRVSIERGRWAETCDQPPRRASHPFTSRDVEATVKSVARRREVGGLRGYGCATLESICVYDGDRKACDYRRRLRKPRRERASLLSVLDLNRWLRAPAQWRPSQEQRRRWLMLDIAALEVVRGYPGGNLITSEAELAWRAGSNRRTVHRDLEAMASAAWIGFSPGI